MTNKDREIVLPSGAFARIRRLRGADFVRYNLERIGKPPEKQDPCFMLLTYCLTIDDQPVTYQQLEEMDIQDIMALSRELNGIVEGPLT